MACLALSTSSAPARLSLFPDWLQEREMRNEELAKGSFSWVQNNEKHIDQTNPKSDVKLIWSSAKIESEIVKKRICFTILISLSSDWCNFQAWLKGLCWFARSQANPDENKMWTRCQIGTSESGFRQCLLIFIITILFNFGGSNVMGDCLGMSL